VAALAAAEAALHDRAVPTVADIDLAERGLHRHLFDTLADAVPRSDRTVELTVAPLVRRELELLAFRVRHREELADGREPTAPGSVGVRALFAGPSGTGKTMAARRLGAELGRDLYRLDMARIVDKYIGETEKRLDAVLSRAEELDVVLLIDEGDSLLTRRTDVHSSNDRYANLETNYLLQRLESFEGIVVVTTNAPERIDQAFERRMDVTIAFHPPDAAEREIIWTDHLGLDVTITPAVFAEIAGRCALTGGQIRNAAAHARLLARHDGEPAVGDGQLWEAVRREYRQAGAVWPLGREHPDA